MMISTPFDLEITSLLSKLVFSISEVFAKDGSYFSKSGCLFEFFIMSSFSIEVESFPDIFSEYCEFFVPFFKGIIFESFKFLLICFLAYSFSKPFVLRFDSQIPIKNK